MNSIWDIVKRGALLSGPKTYSLEQNKIFWNSFRQVQEKDIVMPEQGEVENKILFYDEIF